MPPSATPHRRDQWPKPSTVQLVCRANRIGVWFCPAVPAWTRSRLPSGGAEQSYSSPRTDEPQAPTSKGVSAWADTVATLEVIAHKRAPRQPGSMTPNLRLLSGHEKSLVGARSIVGSSHWGHLAVWAKPWFSWILPCVRTRCAVAPPCRSSHA